MSPFNTLPARRKRIEQGARSPPREPVILVPSPSKSLKAVLALIAGLILLASALPVAAREGAACGVDKAVRFGGVNWESGEFLTAVMRELLERGYGCRTEVVPGNTITLEQALGADDVQIIAEEWVSRSDPWKKAEAAGRVVAVGHPFTDATEGWYVPDYLVHGDPARHIRPSAPDLSDVSQLRDPRYVALFTDAEQPGKGRFLNCPSGWTCEGVNSAKLKAYGLSGAYVDFRPGTGPAMDAAIVSTYALGQPMLFYAFAPSAIAGKLKLFKLREPAYSKACWDDLTSRDGAHRQGCAAPPAVIAYGVSRPYADRAPAIMAVLSRATFPLELVNANLVAIADKTATPTAQALAFLKARPDLWRNWVDPEAADRIEMSLNAGPDKNRATGTGFPAGWTLSIRGPVNAALDQLVVKHGKAFRNAASALLVVEVFVERILRALPWWLVIALMTGAAWAGSRRLALSVSVAVLMLAVGVFGLWDLMIQTLGLVIVAGAISGVIGLGTGIACARWSGLKRVVTPILDIMQTLPSFVYLIPALMLFGLGKAPAILATIIYCAPPMIRLTTLGLEQVDVEAREAGLAFGLGPLQLLWAVELPMARPTIMAGLNQMIMAALSMVVIASMIGARGLGEQVLSGIETLDVGRGLEAGLGIVILAFVLDRVSQGFGAATPKS